MDDDQRAIVQQRVSSLIPRPSESFLSSEGVDPGFRPWTVGLSPSALYNCSLTCRKKAGLKAPEVKWISIKRWVSASPAESIRLPDGVFVSIKRRETFVPMPTARIEKVEYLLVMMPFGNVWSQRATDVPIDEPWLWSVADGKLILEHLLDRDAANPMPGYFRSCSDYARNNPDQIGIHLKRKRATDEA